MGISSVDLVESRVLRIVYRIDWGRFCEGWTSGMIDKMGRERRDEKRGQR